MTSYIRSIENPHPRLQIALAGLIFFALAACSGVGGAGETVLVDGVTVPARMQMATASVGGSYYPVGNAVAQVLSDGLPGVIVTAEVTSGSSQNIACWMQTRWTSALPMLRSPFKQYVGQRASTGRFQYGQLFPSRVLS